MLSNLGFKGILKYSRSKFLQDLYIFFPGGALKLHDFMIVDTYLWWSDKSLLNALDTFIYFYFIYLFKSLFTVGIDVNQI